MTYSKKRSSKSKSRNGRPTLRPGAKTRFSVEEGNRFVVDFKTYDDRSSEGNGLTYRISGGDDAHRFVIDSKTGKLYFAETPDFENPVDHGRNNSYSVRVRVTDAHGAYDDDGFTVHVRDRDEHPVNRRPTLVPGALTQFKVDENQKHVFDFSTHDDNSSEGNGLKYSITGGVDAHLFEIDAVTGKLCFVEAPDFENPLDRHQDNSYAVRVRVTDAQGAFDDDGYTIHVNDVYEAPPGPKKIIGTAKDDKLFGTHGDDHIVALDGRDKIFAGLGDDTLSGVDAHGKRGTGEVDLLGGGAGADTFVLGDTHGAYYLDPGRANFGFASFAIVSDFHAGTDSVILSGSTHYSFTNSGGNSFLFAGDAASGDADAIAKFNNTHLTNADLKSGSFTFV